MRIQFKLQGSDSSPIYMAAGSLPGWASVQWYAPFSQYAPNFSPVQKSMLSPTYVAEVAPKEVRGRITGLFQVCLTVGTAVRFPVIKTRYKRIYFLADQLLDSIRRSVTPPK